MLYPLDPTSSIKTFDCGAKVTQHSIVSMMFIYSRHTANLRDITVLSTFSRIVARNQKNTESEILSCLNSMPKGYGNAKAGSTQFRSCNISIKLLEFFVRKFSLNFFRVFSKQGKQGRSKNKPLCMR